MVGDACAELSEVGLLLYVCDVFGDFNHMELFFFLQPESDQENEMGNKQPHNQL